MGIKMRMAMRRRRRLSLEMYFTISLYQTKEAGNITRVLFTNIVIYFLYIVIVPFLLYTFHSGNLLALQPASGLLLKKTTDDDDDDEEEEKEGYPMYM